MNACYERVCLCALACAGQELEQKSRARAGCRLMGVGAWDRLDESDDGICRSLCLGCRGLHPDHCVRAAAET